MTTTFKNYGMSCGTSIKLFCSKASPEKDSCRKEKFLGARRFLSMRCGGKLECEQRTVWPGTKALGSA